MADNVLKDLEKMKQAMNQAKENQVKVDQPQKSTNKQDNNIKMISYQPPPKYCKDQKDIVTKPIFLNQTSILEINDLMVENNANNDVMIKNRENSKEPNDNYQKEEEQAKRIIQFSNHMMKQNKANAARENSSPTKDIRKPLESQSRTISDQKLDKKSKQEETSIEQLGYDKSRTLDALPRDSDTKKDESRNMLQIKAKLDESICKFLSNRNQRLCSSKEKYLVQNDTSRSTSEYMRQLVREDKQVVKVIQSSFNQNQYQNKLYQLCEQKQSQKIHPPIPKPQKQIRQLPPQHDQGKKKRTTAEIQYERLTMVQKSQIQNQVAYSQNRNAQERFMNSKIANLSQSQQHGSRFSMQLKAVQQKRDQSLKNSTSVELNHLVNSMSNPIALRQSSENTRNDQKFQSSELMTTSKVHGYNKQGFGNYDKNNDKMRQKSQETQKESNVSNINSRNVTMSPQDMINRYRNDQSLKKQNQEYGLKFDKKSSYNKFDCKSPQNDESLRINRESSHYKNQVSDSVIGEPNRNSHHFVDKKLSPFDQLNAEKNKGQKLDKSMTQELILLRDQSSDANQITENTLSNAKESLVFNQTQNTINTVFFKSRMENQNQKNQSTLKTLINRHHQDMSQFPQQNTSENKLYKSKLNKIRDYNDTFSPVEKLYYANKVQNSVTNMRKRSNQEFEKTHTSSNQQMQTNSARSVFNNSSMNMQNQKDNNNSKSELNKGQFQRNSQQEPNDMKNQKNDSYDFAQKNNMAESNSSSYNGDKAQKSKMISIHPYQRFPMNFKIVSKSTFKHSKGNADQIQNQMNNIPVFIHQTQNIDKSLLNITNSSEGFLKQMNETSKQDALRQTKTLFQQDQLSNKQRNEIKNYTQMNMNQNRSKDNKKNMSDSKDSKPPIYLDKVLNDSQISSNSNQLKLVNLNNHVLLKQIRSMSNSTKNSEINNHSFGPGPNAQKQQSSRQNLDPKFNQGINKFFNEKVASNEIGFEQNIVDTDNDDRELVFDLYNATTFNGNQNSNAPKLIPNGKPQKLQKGNPAGKSHANLQSKQQQAQTKRLSKFNGYYQNVKNMV